MANSTAQRLAQCDTAIDQIQALIVSITVNPQPSYSINGESVSWESYLATLTNQLDKLLDVRRRLAGPFIVATRYRP